MLLSKMKAIDWVASLELNDDKKAGFAVTAIYNHLRKVRDWHNEHPYTTIPEGYQSSDRQTAFQARP